MKREAIVEAVRGWLGTPYRHQAATRGAGCDCLGLVRGVWREVIGFEPIALPAYRADWRDTEGAEGLLAAAGRLLVQVGPEMRPGQVIVFRLHRGRVPKHVGIAVAPDRFIHAQEHLGVVEANLTESWRRRVAGLFDFPGVENSWRH